MTLLNHFGLSVSYDSLQRKLKTISAESSRWIEEHASNLKLVDEKVQGKRAGDKVKLR